MRLVLIGGMATGKNYICEYIKNKYGLKKITTYTTRPKRKGEIDGVDYHFISKEDFLKKREVGFFLETQEYSTEHGVWFYGTSKESCVEDNTIIILDFDGWIEYSKIAKNHCIFLQPIDESKRFYEALMREAVITKDAIKEIYRRIETDKGKLSLASELADFIVTQMYDTNTLNMIDDIILRIKED